MGMLRDTFPLHDWQQLFSDPSDFNFSTSRYRTWCIGSHRSKTTCLFDPFTLLEKIQAGFAQMDKSTEISDFFIATTPEILLEAQQLAKVRDIPFIPGKTSLQSLLNAREDAARRRLDARYMLKTQSLAHTDKSLVYFLGDNPKTFGNSWSATSKKVPTYRMNQGLYWIPSLDRWMTCKERLASMGWPVTSECAQSMGTP